ncbi:MAG: hypothetical protein NTW80_10780 [Deltaproteobacteria bacterium]|nr:hypothetical protein [Deltaproteobacteria bacterium]
MKGKIPDRQTCLKLISAIILLVGLGGAALIYQRAGNDAYGALGYEVVDGTIYPLMPEDSKMYRHNLELYGGKLNVIMDDFRRWFLGLWHGKSLAKIIACLSIIISFGFFYAANHLVPNEKLDVPNEDHRDGNV